ncbi:MAG: hypothetical protein J0L78_07075 [Planctomycetes bacterium]|nr:hypothetical protein [Planctomycetota bacterium]
MGGGSRIRTADSVPRALVDAMQGSQRVSLFVLAVQAALLLYVILVQTNGGRAGQLFWWACAVSAVLAMARGFFFVLRFRRYKRLLRIAKTHGGLACTECGYPHDREEAEVVCPECGATIDVARAKEQWARVESL